MLDGQDFPGHGQNPAGIVTDDRRYLGNAAAEQFFADAIDDRTPFDVMMRARHRSEHLRANGNQIGRSFEDEAPQSQGQRQIVDHRRPSVNGGATHGDGETAGKSISLGLGRSEDQPAGELPTKLEGEALIGSGSTEASPERLTTREFGRPIGHP